MTSETNRRDRAGAPEEYSPAYLRYALGLLVTVYMFNFIDRQILVILQEPIKKELGLSDGQFGLLTGFTFAIFYATLGIPIARIADRSVRRNVIAWSLAIWSAMTAVAGLARTFPQLLLARIGVGIGEAGGSPPAHAMISDYFPPSKRARALSIYSMGIYLGILFGFVAGGWLNQFFGWRAALMAVGVPGLLLALLVRFTIREPVRGRSDPGTHAASAPPFAEALATLWALRSFRYLALAGGITSFVTYGTGGFGPAFLTRIHHLKSGEIGTILGLVGGIGGMAGTYLGGYLGDRFGKQDARWYVRVPAICLSIALPLRLVAYLIPDLRVTTVLLGVTELLCLTYLGPVIAMSHAMVSPAMRAFASSILFLAINLIGLGLGPTFTGFLSDGLTQRMGPDGIRWAMVATTAFWLPAIGLFLLATRTLRQDTTSNGGSTSAAR